MNSPRANNKSINKQTAKPLKYVTTDRQRALDAIQEQLAQEVGLEEKPSKSEQKRRMHQAQALGEVLVGLAPSIFRDLPVDESLREALEHARSIKSHEALRRQHQLIGKYMREADTAQIEAFLRQRHVTFVPSK
jgi:ribosomal 50S subunit-associated protein YjgA (DUF615 family)